MGSLFERAREALAACGGDEKVGLTRQIAEAWEQGRLSLDGASAPEAEVRPGLPPGTRTVAPRELPQRGAEGAAARINLFHSIVHIEFSAINLAWDAVWRFRGMPRAYYDDWVRIALEEAHHFEILREHLRQLGGEYGTLPVHQGLWEMAEETAGDPLARMALIPRCLEARGLDVNPGMQHKLRQAGDLRGVELLGVILRDEIGHVAVGDRWFRHLCGERGLPVETTYRDLLARYLRRPLKGPFNREARCLAGFSCAELDALEGERKS